MNWVVCIAVFLKRMKSKLLLCIQSFPVAESYESVRHHNAAFVAPDKGGIARSLLFYIKESDIGINHIMIGKRVIHHANLNDFHVIADDDVVENAER